MITATTLYLLLINSYGMNIQDAAVFTCIAIEESKIVANATHLNNNGTTDYGIFQINEVNMDLCEMSEQELLQPRNNIKCALKILKYQDFKAWATKEKCIQ